MANGATSTKVGAWSEHLSSSMSPGLFKFGIAKLAYAAFGGNFLAGLGYDYTYIDSKGRIVHGAN